jgi:hypothetical protein
MTRIRVATLEVIAAIRDDVVAKMYARHQIDRACFLAARDYQKLFELAALDAGDREWAH